MRLDKKVSIWRWVLTVVIVLAFFAPTALVATEGGDENVSLYDVFPECFSTDQGSEN